MNYTRKNIKDFNDESDNIKNHRNSTAGALAALFYDALFYDALFYDALLRKLSPIPRYKRFRFVTLKIISKSE